MYIQCVKCYTCIYRQLLLVKCLARWSVSWSRSCCGTTTCQQLPSGLRDSTSLWSTCPLPYRRTSCRSIRRKELNLFLGGLAWLVFWNQVEMGYRFSHLSLLINAHFSCRWPRVVDKSDRLTGDRFQQDAFSVLGVKCLVHETMI